MKIKDVILEPLESKHYLTEVVVYVEDAHGREWTVGVDIHGYYPNPSQREFDDGWEPDRGMDHVETEAEYKIALAVAEALKGKTL